MPQGNIRHGKYVIELSPLYSAFTQVKSPQFAASGERDMDKAPFCLGWSLITEPFVMMREEYTRDFDQYLFLVGGDPTNVYDSFDGEVEFGIEGEIQIITYPVCLFLPRGTRRGPWIFKKVNKPMMFMDALTASFLPPMPSESKKGG